MEMNILIKFRQRSKNIGILKKISHLLSTSVLLQLYNTLVLHYLKYCNMIWTAASESLLNNVTGLTKEGCSNC